MMKKFFTFFILLIALATASAQTTVDLAITGFADENGNPINVLALDATEALKPRVFLKNNGPGVVAVTDSVIFDITHHGNYYATSLVLTGAQLHTVGSGSQVIVDLSSPIWTAQQMNEGEMTSFELCYEVRIVGSSTDPNYGNNIACIPVTRPLAVDDTDFADVMLFPNPASSSVTLTGARNARVQLFDLSGRQLSVIENASESQRIDVSSLAKGLYIVRITDGQHTISKKLNVVR